MKNTTLLTIFFFVLNLSFAQSFFNDGSGSSSIIIGAGMTSHNYFTSLNTSLGYSHRGMLDVGVSLKKGTMSQMEGIYNIKKRSLSPFINLVLLNSQSYEAPFSLALTAEYDTFSMKRNSGNTLMYRRNNVIELGARIYTFIQFTDGFAFHPAFRVSYSNDRMEFTDSSPVNDKFVKSIRSESTTLSNYAKAEFFIPMSFTYNGKDRLTFSPSAAFSSVGPEVNVAIGYNLATSSNNRCGKYGCPIFGR